MNSAAAALTWISSAWPTRQALRVSINPSGCQPAAIAGALRAVSLPFGVSNVAQAAALTTSQLSNLTTDLLAALTTKGFWLRPKEVRDLIDDEGTRANRVAALGWGFVMAILSAIALYMVSIFSPVSEREAIHVIVSLGIGAALVRFGMLERRAFRDA